MTFPRCVLLITAIMALMPQLAPAQSSPIGQKMATFLESQKGKRIGGGECAHVASEALRMAGGEFIGNDIGADSPGRGDYVWGTPVTVIEVKGGRWSDSNPTNKAQVGDILQYRNAVISLQGGGTNGFSHHTSVVAAVNSAGRPTQVYQQNMTFNGVNTRIIRRDDMNLTRLTSGWVRIYRPKLRLDKKGQYKFSLVNLHPGKVKYSVTVGTFQVTANTLDVNNKQASYTAGWYTISGSNAPVIVLANGPRINIENGVGYEVYVGPDKMPAIRKLPY